MEARVRGVSDELEADPEKPFKAHRPFPALLSGFGFRARRRASEPFPFAFTCRAFLARRAAFLGGAAQAADPPRIRHLEEVVTCAEHQQQDTSKVQHPPDPWLPEKTLEPKGETPVN